MKVRFLCTNGWYSTDGGNTPCVLIESEKCYTVLDAGDGIYKLEDYVKTEKPIHLFLYHLHLDHIIGFHLFNRFKFKQPVNVYGFRGIKDGLRLIRHPYTFPFDDLPYPVKIYELQEAPTLCLFLLLANFYFTRIHVWPIGLNWANGWLLTS